MIDAPKSIAACAEYYVDEYHSVRECQMDCKKIFQSNENLLKDFKEYNLNDLNT